MDEIERDRSDGGVGGACVSQDICGCPLPSVKPWGNTVDWKSAENKKKSKLAARHATSGVILAPCCSCNSFALEIPAVLGAHLCCCHQVFTTPMVTPIGGRRSVSALCNKKMDGHIS